MIKNILKVIIFLFFASTHVVFANKKKPTNDNPPLALRGADIGDVSRLVIDGLPTKGYTLVPQNNVLKIVFPEFEYSFLEKDMLAMGVLANIKKLSFEQKDEAGILTIEYSCACQGDFYKWHNQKLVLDVFSLNASGNPLKVKGKKLEVSNKNKSLKKLTEKDDDNHKLNTQKNNQTDSAINNFENNLNNLIMDAEKQGIIKLNGSEAAKRIEDLHQKQLDELLTKQASQIEKESSLSNTNNDPLQESIRNNDSLQSNLDNGDVKKINNNLYVSHNDNSDTVSEREQLLPTDENIFQNGTQTCLPNSAFKLPPNDSQTDTFYDKISDYRNNLIGEFDSVNPENALKLVNHYISYGLGEEALQVLDTFPTPEHRGHIARSMAELMTNRTPSKTSVFNISKNCGDAHGLWSAYLNYKLGNEKKAVLLSNVGAVSEILQTLPNVLQSQIGTALALNLVRQGSYEKASDMIDELAKKNGQFSPNVLLVRGLIDAKNGLSNRAIVTLENVINKTNGPDQQMAGLALAELKLASGYELNVRDVSILEELVFLKARELIGVQALSLIAENESRYGNFDAAFDRLNQKIYDNPNIMDPAQIKAEQLFKRIAVSGEAINNPETFMIYWKFPNLIPEEPILLKSFAEKLFSQGYDEPTIEVIGDIEDKFPSYAISNDLTYLKGQAFFRSGEYQKTVDTLTRPFDDKEYLSLKAEALHKIGKNDLALKTLKKFKDKDSVIAKARYALAAKEWSSVNKAYEEAKNIENDPEYYYAAKAGAYMSGYQYPGSASEYKRPEDVVFHQPDRQAKSVENVVIETKKLIELIKNRSSLINNILHKNKEKPIIGETENG